MADPPWKQSKAGKKSVRKNSSGEPLDYPVCTLEEIKEHLAKADEHTEDNAFLFLWTIDKYLFEAEQISRELGYKLYARMVWNKVTGITAAFTIRSNGAAKPVDEPLDTVTTRDRFALVTIQEVKYEELDCAC